MTVLLGVMLAGGVGCGVRWAVTMGLQAMPPVATLLCNAVGCGLMGALHALNQAGKISAPLAAALAVGLLGGLTTFSSFVMDALTLLERRGWMLATGYLLGTVILGLVLARLGGVLAQLLWLKA